MIPCHKCGAPTLESETECWYCGADLLEGAFYPRRGYNDPPGYNPRG